MPSAISRFHPAIIIAAETVHGILRGVLLVPIVGDLPARQIGVLIGSLLIFAVAYLFILWMAAQTKLQLLAVGLLWVVLTILFKIGLGRLVLGLPWERLTEDYDVPRGGFMGVGLLLMAASPWLSAWLRGAIGIRSTRPLRSSSACDASPGRRSQAERDAARLVK